MINNNIPIPIGNIETFTLIVYSNSIPIKNPYNVSSIFCHNNKCMIRPIKPINDIPILINNALFSL